MSCIKPGERYALSVPPTCRISIRGMDLMIEEYTREYEGAPIGLILTEAQFRRLCSEAARSGKTFADDTCGSLPTFRGLPIDFIDDSHEWDALVVAMEALDEVGRD